MKNSDVSTVLLNSNTKAESKAEYTKKTKKLAQDEGKTITNEDIERANKRQRMSIDADAGRPACGGKAPQKWMNKYNDLVEHYKLNGPNASVLRKQNVKLADW